MRLTLHTHYAVRVLLYVGLKRDELATVAEIVRHFDISKGHVMKVVHRLAQLGYVHTLRGKTLLWPWMRLPGDVVVALGALVMAWDFAVKSRPLLPQFVGRWITGSQTARTLRVSSCPARPRRGRTLKRRNER